MLKSFKRAAMLVLGCCAPALAQGPWISEHATPAGSESSNWFDSRAVTTWWDNGPCDDVTAMQSQYNATTGKQQCVADDYVLKAGLYYYYDSISFDFYVDKITSASTAGPSWSLDLYKDCNGKPAGAPVASYTAHSKLDQGPSTKFANYNKWTVTFTNINRYEAGHESDCVTAKRYWLSPKGLGSGLYFWRSANNGTIQGAVSMYKNNFTPGGVPDWTETFNVCCQPVCTDFCFNIDGLVCCLLHDNSKYELTGLSSLQGNIIDFGTRAADNFQVPPGGCCVDICRIEAWVATNCDITKIFGEIYDNDCNCPDTGSNQPIHTLIDPIVTATGEVTVTDGIPIYHVLWHDPGICLEPGRNYWFSAIARGSGQIFEVAYFLFKDHNLPCPILISEGKYKNCWVGPLDWTSTSDPLVYGFARDFAFRVYVKAPTCQAGSDVGTGCPSDYNGDGFVNGIDFDEFVAAFEAGC
jgi:hypothetical protein